MVCVLELVYHGLELDRLSVLLVDGSCCYGKLLLEKDDFFLWFFKNDGVSQEFVIGLLELLFEVGNLFVVLIKNRWALWLEILLEKVLFLELFSKGLYLILFDSHLGGQSYELTSELSDLDLNFKLRSRVLGLNQLIFLFQNSDLCIETE